MTARELALRLAEAVADQKGQEIRVLHLGEISSIADYFVLASGTSDRHVRTLADAVQDAGRKVGQRALASEGEDRARWVLVDFGNVIVHLFQREVREFYALERLWGEAEDVELSRAAGGS